MDPRSESNVKSFPGPNCFTCTVVDLQALDVLQDGRASCAVSVWKSEDGKRWNDLYSAYNASRSSEKTSCLYAYGFFPFYSCALPAPAPYLRHTWRRAIPAPAPYLRPPRSITSLFTFRKRWNPTMKGYNAVHSLLFVINIGLTGRSRRHVALFVTSFCGNYPAIQGTVLTSVSVMWAIHCMYAGLVAVRQNFGSDPSGSCTHY